MKIDFRQGIVTYPEVAGTGQAFLLVTGGGVTVDLLAGSGQTSIAFAQRTADYLYIETNTISSAWSGISAGTTTWLYWDIDTKTGIRTFGQTIVQPVSQNTQPGILTTDLHWFDTVNNAMKVYDGTRFIERIRVFAARIEGTTLFPMGSNAQLPYAGTQAGINRTTFAGQILFAEGLPVIISIPGTFSPTASNPFARNFVFATTETAFLMGGSQKVNSIRLESDVTTATVTQNVAAYDVIKYSGFGTIEPAGYNDIDTTTLGIVVDSHAVNEIATVIIQGVVLNEAWSWTVVGAELWVLENGDLTQDDPNLTTPSLYPVSKPPVARVLSTTEIIFMQGLGKVGPRGLNPESIGTIGDVTLTQPVTAGDVIRFSGSPEQWRNSRSAIDEFSDVEITSPVPGEALVYTGSPVQWRNANPSIGVLNDIQDVIITAAGSPIPGSPSTSDKGDILYSDGRNWRNLAPGTANQILTMDSGSPLLPVWKPNQGIGGAGSPVQNIVGGDGIDVTLGSPTATIAVDSTVARLNIGSPGSGSPQSVGQTFTGNQTFADSVTFEKDITVTQAGASNLFLTDTTAFTPNETTWAVRVAGNVFSIISESASGDIEGLVMNRVFGSPDFLEGINVFPGAFDFEIHARNSTTANADAYIRLQHMAGDPFGAGNVAELGVQGNNGTDDFYFTNANISGGWWYRGDVYIRHSRDLGNTDYAEWSYPDIDTYQLELFGGPTKFQVTTNTTGSPSTLITLLQTTTIGAGGLLVNNTLTGAGLERVLTLSDLVSGGSPADQLNIVAGDGITFGSPNITIAVDSTVARLNVGSPGSGSPQSVGQRFTGNQTFADVVTFNKDVTIEQAGPADLFLVDTTAFTPNETTWIIRSTGNNLSFRTLTATGEVIGMEFLRAFGSPDMLEGINVFPGTGDFQVHSKDLQHYVRIEHTSGKAGVAGGNHAVIGVQDLAGSTETFRFSGSNMDDGSGSGGFWFNDGPLYIRHSRDLGDTDYAQFSWPNINTYQLDIIGGPTNFEVAVGGAKRIRVVLPSLGGLFANNEVTGGSPHFERVLTLSDINLTGFSGVIGDVLFYNGTAWVTLPRGTTEQVLTTFGSPLLPIWRDATGGAGGGGAGAVAGGDGTFISGSPFIEVNVDATVARLNVGSPSTLGSPSIGQRFTGNQTFADTVNFLKIITIGSPHVSTLTVSQTVVGGSPVIQTVIASHAIATYRSAEYQIQAVRGNNFHTTRIFAVHDGTNADSTEFGTITLPSFFGSPAAGSPTISGVQATYDVDVSSGNLRLLATPIDATGNITFKVQSNLITI